MIKIKAIVFTACVGCLIEAKSSTNKPQLLRDSFQRKGTAMQRRVLPSGLAYEVLVKAPDSAAYPSKGRRVTVHYTGWLSQSGIPGKKFDSSLDRGEPFTFAIGVGHVIKGWDEGVMGMKVGEKRRLYIPAALAYGTSGAGSLIPPHADLIFDVELISV